MALTPATHFVGTRAATPLPLRQERGLLAVTRRSMVLNPVPSPPYPEQSVSSVQPVPRNCGQPLAPKLEHMLVLHECAIL
jgi:hypothetical protein